MAKKLHTMSSFTKILPIVSRIFPEGLLKSLAKECFPGDYDRKASPQELIRALLKAQTLLLPSQEEIIKKNPRLGLSARTSLTYNFCLPSLLQFAKEMMSHLHQIHPMINSQLLATPRLLLDTMPQTLPATQRGKGAKINNVSRGMGVMFAFNLDAMPGQCPIDILGIFRGSWNDTYKVRQVALIANGPVYIADRGFYSRETVKLWLDQHINFIVRGKSAKMSWKTVRKLQSCKRRFGKVLVEADEIVDISPNDPKFSCEVRLIRGILTKADGKCEKLYLLTDQLDLSTQQVLDMYLVRGKIEVYHRFIKQSLGLAHLYSFDDVGMECQAIVAALLSNLLYLAISSEGRTQETVLELILQLLHKLREEIGIMQPWRRNTYAQRRTKTAPSNAKALKRRKAMPYKYKNL